MSFYLGSFAGGLFNGASSAFQLYNMYQGIQRNQYDLDAAAQAKETLQGDAVNKNVPGYQPGMDSAPSVKIPAGDVSGSPSSGPYVVGGTASVTPGTSSPATTTHSGPVKVPAHSEVWGPGGKKEGEKEPGAAGGKGEAPGGYAADNNRVLPAGYALRDPYENARPPLPVDTGRDTVPGLPAPPPPPGPPAPATSVGSVDEYGRPIPAAAIPRAAPAMQGPPPAQVQQPPTSAGSVDEYGRPISSPGIMPVVPAVPPVVPPSAQPPVAPTVPPAPDAPRPASGIESPRIVPPAAVAAPAPAEVPPPPRPPVPSAWELHTALRHGFLPTNTPIDAQTNSYYDGKQWNPIPPGVRTQGQQPAAPAQTAPAPPAPAPIPTAEGGAGAGAGAGEGGGAFSRALAAINPVGSARAGEATAQLKASLPVVDPDTGQLSKLPPAVNVQPPEQPTQTAQAEKQPEQAIPTLTVKPDPLTGQPKPTTPPAATKASPETPPQQQAPAPVPVKSGEAGGKAGGDTGKVVPDQKGDAQQSESTNTSYAPPVNPSPWRYLQANDPQKAQLIKDAVDKYGGGSVTYEQVAAHWANESNFGYTSVTSKNGAIGPMQILESTHKAMDPRGDFDINTVQGGLAVAVTYLKHLAVDEHLGANSVMTNFAYMRGPGAARAAQADFDGTMRSMPVAFQGLAKFYPDMQLGKDQFPGNGGGQSYRDNYRQILQQTEPDGVLHMLATTGPTGMGMTDRWKMLEGSLVAAAIAHGNFEAVQHVSDWVAQMSHQGALSNLALASTMMQQGNMEGAAGALAKAHAFFPDGTYGRFGVDAKGRLFGEQFSESTGQSMGPAFQISNEHVMQQMLQLQNPRNYIQALQAYQKNNAEIDLARAHAQHYRDEPELRQAAIDARRDAQAERERAADERLRSRQQHDFDLAGAKEESRVGNEDKVDTAVNTDYKERTTAARDAVAAAGDDPAKRTAAEVEARRLGNEAQISRELRVQQMHGGYGMAGPAADALAENITKGRSKIRGIVMNGTPMYGVFDQKASEDDIKAGTAKPQALLGNARGARIQGLAGSDVLGAPALPMAPKDTGGRQQASLIGAGLNDPRSAGRFNSNLAGIQPVSQMA